MKSHEQIMDMLDISQNEAKDPARELDYFITRTLPRELPFLLSAKNLAVEAKDFKDFSKLSQLTLAAVKEAESIAKKYKISN